MKRLLIILSITLFSACTFFNASVIDQISDFDQIFLLSHLEATDQNIALDLASRAAIPATLIAGTPSISLTGSTNVNISNYPEMGQSSKYTISNKSGSVYKVSVTTTYQGGWLDGVRQSTTEEYYLQDIGTIGFYDGADQIIEHVAYDNDATIILNSLDRIKIETTYTTKKGKDSPGYDSWRNENIVLGQGTTGYSSFSSYDMSNYDWNYSPSLDASGVNWCSEVAYTQQLPAGQLGIDIISSTTSIYYLEGKRFYTEIGDQTTQAVSSIAIERVWDGPFQTGRVLAQILTRVSYTRTNGSPSISNVYTQAWYYLQPGDEPFIVTKNGSGSTTPLP